jgi:hypothetical protein
MSGRARKLRYLLAFLCLIVIALGSAYVGGRIGYEAAKRKFQRNNNPEAWHIHAMRALEERLELNDEQRDQIKAHIRDAVTRLKLTRDRTMRESDVVVEELFAAVDAELRPPQQLIFRELIRDRRRVKQDILSQNEPPGPLGTTEAVNGSVKSKGKD